MYPEFVSLHSVYNLYRYTEGILKGVPSVISLPDPYVIHLVEPTQDKPNIRFGILYLCRDSSSEHEFSIRRTAKKIFLGMLDKIYMVFTEKRSLRTELEQKKEVIEYLYKNMDEVADRLESQLIDAQEAKRDLEQKVEERTEQNKLLLLELSELDKLKFTQHLLAKARHELNNPLTVLSSAIGRIDRAYQDYVKGASVGEPVLGKDIGLAKQWDQTLTEIEKVYNILETLKPFAENLGGYRQSVADVVDGKECDKASLRILYNSLEPLAKETAVLEERMESSTVALLDFRTLLDKIESVTLPRAGAGLPGIVEEELNSGIATAKNEIGNMAGVINTLAEFAKVGKYSQGKERIELRNFLEQYETRYKTKFQDSGIDFKVIAEKPFYVKADQIQLYEIFDNLMNNSIEANAKRIEVKVYEKELPGGVIYNEVQVKDDGKGFKPEDKESIFLPFSSTKGGKLSGIGLGVVKSIVSTNKGFVDCEAKPGDGASFYITLPQYERQG